MNQSATTDLALLGGTPVCDTPLAAPPWPPVRPGVGEKLRDLYESRQWSFNSPSEQQFAAAFARMHDARHGIFMANGTVTLECALAACGIGPGDEVIVPALTWLASAMAAHYLGATPVFVDVQPQTLCLDPQLIEQAITARTKAIMPVHLYGSMADLDAINTIARQHNLKVIEDCAHMQGGKWDGRGAGSHGDVGSFSFQQSKNMSAGEGGICITNDDELAERIFRLKHIGYPDGSKQGSASTPPPPGLMCRNYRSTAFQAVILQEELNHLEARLDRYNAGRDRLDRALDDVPGVRIQSRGRSATRQGYYCVVFIFDEPPLADVPRAAIERALAAEGLPILGTYGPVYNHTLYNMPPSTYRISPGGCPVSQQVGTDRAFVLLHQWLACDENVIDTIAAIIKKVATHADELRAIKK